MRRSLYIALQLLEERRLHLCWASKADSSSDQVGSVACLLSFRAVPEKLAMNSSSSQTSTRYFFACSAMRPTAPTESTHQFRCDAFLDLRGTRRVPPVTCPCIEWLADLSDSGVPDLQAPSSFSGRESTDAPGVSHAHAAKFFWKASSCVDIPADALPNSRFIVLHRLLAPLAANFPMLLARVIWNHLCHCSQSQARAITNAHEIGSKLREAVRFAHPSPAGAPRERVACSKRRRT